MKRIDVVRICLEYGLAIAYGGVQFAALKLFDGSGDQDFW
jgi:hypothetical protein